MAVWAAKDVIRTPSQKQLSGDGGNRLLSWLIVLSLILHGVMFFFFSDPFRTRDRSPIELTMENIVRPLTRDIPRPQAPPARQSSLLPEKTKRHVAPRIETPQEQQPLDRLDIPPLPEIAAVQAPPAPAPPLASLRQDNKAVDKYLAAVRASIERNKKYPLAARARQLEGEVGIRFVLTATGDVQLVEVKKSSGNNALDRAALAAVRRAAPFPSPPEGFIVKKLPVEITIVFKLT